MGRAGNRNSETEHILLPLQVAAPDLQFLEVLGHGSGGTVYRAFHQPSRIIMAVKVLTLDATPEEQRQIMSELEILHRVRGEGGKGGRKGGRREGRKGEGLEGREEGGRVGGKEGKGRE